MLTVFKSPFHTWNYFKGCLLKSSMLSVVATWLLSLGNGSWCHDPLLERHWRHTSPIHWGCSMTSVRPQKWIMTSETMVTDVMIHFWSVTDVIPHQNHPEGALWRHWGPRSGSWPAGLRPADWAQFNDLKMKRERQSTRACIHGLKVPCPLI